MNLNQLKYAKMVGELRSFSLAAKHCHVTQPTLSNAIAQLETELGALLFQRSTRTVNLSAFGQTLLPLIEAVLVSQNELKKAAQGFINPEQKLCRLGMSPVIDSQLLIMLIDAFSHGQSDVEFIYKECLLDDLGNRIELEQVDFVFRIAQPVQSYEEVLPFYQEAIYFLPANSTISGPTIELSKISNEIFVLGPDGCGLAGVTRALFKQHSLDLKIYRGQAVNYSVMEEWASLGIGATILPASKITAGNSSASKITVNNEPILIDYEIAWNKSIRSFPHLQQFQQHLHEKVAAISNGRLTDRIG